MSENTATQEDVFGPGRLYLPALSEPMESDPAERLLRVTITTRDCDREGDVVEPNGLDFANYLSNPVVLWAHDLSAAPIGRVRSLEVRADRVDATVQFADTPHGREIHQLYADRYLNAWSIGFLARAWEPIEQVSSDEAEEVSPRGFHITSAEVVELSAVPVPANPAALTRALNEGDLALSPRLRKALDLPTPASASDEAARDSHIVTSPEVRADVAPTTRSMRSAATRPRRTLTRVLDTACERAREMMRRELRLAVARARGDLG